VVILTKWKETEIGKIPQDWEITTIGDLFFVKNGKTNTQDAVANGKYPLFDRSIQIKLSNKYLFDSEAIIMPGEGKEFIPHYFFGKFDLHQRVYAITPKTTQVCLKFFYYWMYYYRNYLARIAVGSTVKSLRLNHLTGFPAPNPALSEQCAIAKVFSDLDEKIELNNQMNKTLEDIAQAIFKRWFIDFEFPNEKGEPYKSSGGEMVESELGMIPKGWEVKFIEDLFIFKKGEEVGSKNYSDSQNSDFIQFYRVHDISSYGNQSKTYVDKKLIKTGFFKNDDILVSLDGTIGRVYFGGNGAYSSGIRKIESKYSFLGKGAILSLLKSELFQNELILYSADATTIKHASAAIKNIKIVYNKNILERYSKVTEPIFNMMLNNVNNNSSLINIRDFLLPKLMTGKIKVPIKGFT